MTKTETLKKENAKLAAMLTVAVDGLEDLRNYVGSSKFHANPMVNTSDIHLRVREVESAITDAQFRSYEVA
jgi:hypothetical protein